MIDDLTELRTNRNMISTFCHLKEQFTQKSFTHPHIVLNPYEPYEFYGRQKEIIQLESE